MWGGSPPGYIGMIAVLIGIPSPTPRTQHRRWKNDVTPTPSLHHYSTAGKYGGQISVLAEPIDELG